MRFCVIQTRYDISSLDHGILDGNGFGKQWSYATAVTLTGTPMAGAPLALLIKIVRFHQGHSCRSRFAPNDRGVRSWGQRRVDRGLADVVRLK
jgi:hypothetical protein